MYGLKIGDDVNGTNFKEVEGPWKQNFDDTAVITADLNQDGLDDLILCASASKSFSLCKIATDGSYLRQLLSIYPADDKNYIWNWRNMGVRDFGA